MKKLLEQHRLLAVTAFLSLGLAITYACKDFLKTPAQGTLDETTLVSKPGLEGALIAAYRVLDCTNATASWGCAASNWVFGSITSDDAYKGSQDTDQPGATQVELYNWQAGQAQEYLDAKWATVYEGVVRSNATLRLLERVQREKPSALTAAEADAIRGEALFLRAHYHFEAWRFWGNIPYYLETDTDFRKPNDLGSTGVIAAVIADLNTAIGLLPPTPRNGEKGRATSWTATAYKGRVQASAGQWTDALTTLRAVRASGVYALEKSFDRVWTAFQQFANGPETIWAYQASVNDGDPEGRNANWGETLNFPHENSPFGCCGFHQPSQNLVNFYATDPLTGLPRPFTNPATWNDRDSTWVADLVVSVKDTLDPRVDWTVGRDGVPFKDWGLHNPTWPRNTSYGGRYSPKKNVHERRADAQSQVGWNAAQLNSVHIHLFRYADMLLLLAEAEVEAGLIANAQTIVNEIRARADSAAQGCGAGSTIPAIVTRYPACAGDDRIVVPTNDPSIGWARYRVGQYVTPWPDQATARLAVRIERRLELAMEGQRLFDLRRWGLADAQQTINGYLAKERLRRTYKTAQLDFEDRHMLYPIPQVQIDLSKVAGQDRLVQNPNW